MDNNKTVYSRGNGGRAILLFLLFSIAILNFLSSGYSAFVAVMCIPAIALVGYFLFSRKMAMFYTLFIVNTIIMFIERHFHLPVPVSLINELFELMLIGMVLVDHWRFHLSRLINVMFLCAIVWVMFCCIEIFNDQCGLGIDVYRWYTGARLMSMQILYAFVVTTLFIDTPKKIMTLLFIWAVFIVFAAIWLWKQKNIGLTEAESRFLWSSPAHIMGGKIRYFSCFTDAANFGIHTAVASAAFLIIAATMKVTRIRIFFAIVGCIGIWAFFGSGTRTAIFCFIATIMVFIVLCKNKKLILSVSAVFLVFLYILIFTNIGDSNQNIRRMRTAFDKEDASLGVREQNKATLRKYMVDAPWGVGIGLENGDVPPRNKVKLITQVAPDSEYVYIWVRTGVVGLTVFCIINAVMFLGACWIVFFRLKNPSIRGVGIAYTAAFIGMHLGGYANQILLQFPNVLIYYGGLATVYLLPHIENEWNEWEAKLIAEQEERRRLKLEKKRASRV